MAFDVSQLVDYTPSQIALAAKTAMMSAALGGTKMIIDGREIARITSDEAQKLYDWAQTQIALDDPTTCGGIVLVKWGEAQ